MRRINPDDCRWQSAPPQFRGEYYEVVSPLAGQQITLGIVAPRMYGLWTHWHLGRTRPCIGRVTDCEGCQLKLGKRWKGYLGCYRSKDRKLVIAEITAKAARECPVLYNGEDTLRGMTVLLSRLSGGRTGPVRAELFPRRDGINLPEEFNLVGALLNIWGFVDETTYKAAFKVKQLIPTPEEEREEAGNRLF